MEKSPGAMPGKKKISAEKTVTARETERIRESSETKEATGGGGVEMGSLGCSTGCTSESPYNRPGTYAWWRGWGYCQQVEVITMTTSFCHLQCPVLSYRNLTRVT